MSDLERWPKGERLFDEIRERSGDTVILGFSRGKDAIGAAVELVKHFNVIPVYYDTIPGLEFVAESIAYYERVLFKRKILVVPHPNFFRMLENYVFQDPDAFYMINDIPFPQWSHEDVRKWVCRVEGLPPDTWQATGVRAADSVTRRTALAKNGPITNSKHTFHAVWDWNKARLIEEMQKADIKLPLDYRLWGRTLDGVDARFMWPMKQHLPEDYRRSINWFPFIPTDLIRYLRLREGITHAEARKRVLEE